MNEGRQLDELIAIIDAQPGDAPQIINPHIPIEELLPVAQRRTWGALTRNISLGGGAVEMQQLHNMMSAAYMDGFAHGCGWAKMKQGSGEK